MKTEYLLSLLIISGFIVYGCAQNQKESLGESSEFKAACQSAGYEWMLMKPTQDGKFIKDAESCWGCMVEGVEHVCDKEKLQQFIPPK